MNLLAIVELIAKNLTDRIALGILFMSTIMLAVVYWFPSLLGPAALWFQGHPQLFIFGILGPICYIPTGPIISKFQEWQTNSKARRDKEREAQERCHIFRHLTMDDKALLAPYIRDDCRSRRIVCTDSVAKGLAESGILYIPDVPRDSLGRVAYNIHDWAKEHLKSHPALLEIRNNSN